MNKFVLTTVGTSLLHHITQRNDSLRGQVKIIQCKHPNELDDYCKEYYFIKK